MIFASTDPYTGQMVKSFPTATDDEVDAAIARAHETFQSWRDTSFAARAAIMQRAADLLRRDSDRFAPLLTLEMGKLASEARGEVELSAAIFEYYARNAEALLARVAGLGLDPAAKRALQVTH